jgi:shikimate kinase
VKNVVLIGMPASGKSTVGVILAKLLGYNFLDTDILLALEQGRPLPQIISEDGYDRFIQLEGLVGEGLRCGKTVIATGGSMVFSENAMRALSENALVVWLDVPPEELERRMAGGLAARGVATPFEMTVAEIYATREPLYRKYAGLRVPSEGSTEEAATALRNRLFREKLL